MSSPAVTQTRLAMGGSATRRALALYLEDTAAVQRRLAVDAVLPKFEKQIARWFMAQGKTVIQALSAMADRFDRNAADVAALRGVLAEQAAPVRPLREDLSPAEWEYLLAQALFEDYPDWLAWPDNTQPPPGSPSALSLILTGFMAAAFLSGSESVVLGSPIAQIDTRFGFGSDDAMAYARNRAAARVTGINDTTRNELNRLISTAVNDGADWKKLGRLIEGKYADFAGPPLFPSKKFHSRAEAVAAFEIGDAYEGGQWARIERQRGLGDAFEKKWLNAGDSKVRPAHVVNARADWVPMDDAFPGDGASRPPTDPGCRCTTIWRRVARVG